jgi:hypothetical protein
MGITSRNPGRVWYGTLAEFTASTSKRKKGDVCIPTDSEEIRICNGDDVFADLLSLPYGQAAAIAALGTTTNMSASNLTAAIPTAPTKAEVDAGINALAAKAEARLDAIESKVDAFLASLKAAGLMAS